MIEFALILPIFMFMIMFTLDMGKMVLMSGAMQDATFSAARTGAQLGGAGLDPTSTSGGQICNNGSTCDSSLTYSSLLETAQQIPGYGGKCSDVAAGSSLGCLRDMTIERGAVCADNPDNDHVAIRARYSTTVTTPFLLSLMDMFSDGRDSRVQDGKWTLYATAVARCEVIRS
jgi:hypothetical protein